MPPSKADYYNILGVFRDATQEDIKRAYLEAAHRLHPDKNVAAGETELFLDAQQAYEVLTNPTRRKQYDATLPPEIEENKHVRHSIYFSRPSLVRMGEDQLLYILLEVEPREEKKESLPAPPLNICLVLDRSTSMQGEKMDILKSTAIQLLRRLRPQDVLSIVAFSDRAEVIVPASINLDKKKYEARIQMMQASGATEIYHGLETGLQELNRTQDATRVNHLILLTDGNTYGDEQACLELAAQAAKQNIGITGMGVGHEWNDIFLDALASKTGGSSAYISNPKDIEKLLIDKFKALASTFADEVTLEFTPNKNIRINYAFRLQPEGGPIQIESLMRLGPILRDAPLHVLIEFIISPTAFNENDTISILDGVLKTSVTANPLPATPIRLNLTRNLQPAPATEPPPTQILKALSRLTLYRMQERAQAAVDSGQIDAAVRHLQNLATHLLSQGEHSLAKTALFEADTLERMHTWSDGGSKEIKYQTRALLLGSAKKEKIKP